jgi:sn-glycerol 3-phosphate transport system permease protein
LGSHLLLLIACVVVAFPIVWMISSAFKVPTELFTEDIRILPQHPTLQNFIIAWRDYGVPRWFLNSLVTAAGITIGQILTSILAAYGFGVFRFRGRETLFTIFLGSMIVPFQVTMIPNYIFIAKLNLLNTWWAVILPNLATAFGVFLLRQYFLAFPRDFFDAAKLDGANSWQILWRIAVPLGKAPIFALIVLFALDAWNMYFWPLLVLTEQTARTIPIGLQQFLDHEMGHRWGPFMATATLASLPALLAYLVAQRQIMSTFITTGSKG